MRILAFLLILTTACSSEQQLAELKPDAPSFSVTSPMRASWNSEGPTFLTGNATHIEHLLVNGLPYEVENEDFSVPIELNRGINYFEIEAMAAGGHWFYDRRAVIAGEFAPAEGDISEAAEVRINQTGLDDVSMIIADLINTQDITTSVTSMNPVVDLEYSVGTSISVDLQTIHFNTPQIEMVATEETLNVEVVLPNLFIDTDADISVLWVESDQSLQIVADSAVIDTELLVEVSDGVIQIETLSTEVWLDGFSYDVSLIPGQFVEDNVFNDTIRSTIEDELAQEIGAQLPEIITDLQDDLDLNFEFDLMGTEVALDAIVANGGVDDNGVWLGLDLGVEAGDSSYTAKGKGYLSSSATTPTPDRFSDTALVVSDNAMNRAFYELWAGGMFSQVLSTENGSLNTEDIPIQGISNCTIVTNPSLPPVLVEVDGSMQLQVGEVEIDLMTPGFYPGEYIKFRVAGYVSVDIVFDAGSVKPVLSDMEMHIDVVETNWSTNQESLIALVNALVTPELLLGAVEDIAIEIPSISGIEINDAAIHREDTGFHTGLLLNISVD